MTERLYPNAREKILDAAAAVILRDGAAQMTVDAVVAEAGVSKGGLFYHFPSKDALIEGLIHRVDDQWMQALEAARGAEAPGPGRFVRAVFRSFFNCPAATGDDSNCHRLCGALAAVAISNPKLLTRTRATYARILRELAEDGLPVGRALMVFAALDGLWAAQVFGMYELTEAQRSAVREELKELLEKYTAVPIAWGENK